LIKVNKMEVSVDISMYPLADDYNPAIDSFIEGLNGYKFRVITNTMSTQLFGNYDDIWNAIVKEQKKAFEKGGRFALTFKVINRDLDPAKKPHGDKYISRR